MKKRRKTDQLTTLQGPNPAVTESLEALYDGCYDRIYAYCVHRLFCRTTAEDVTGQIFLNAARGIHSIVSDGPEVHVRWLYGIATNECNSYLRKHLNRCKLFEQFQHEQNHHHTDAQVPPDWTGVYAAIAQLKEIEQTVITLRFFEHMGYDKIAAIINKREASVRVIQHRALKKLRKLLNPANSGFRGVGYE